MANSPEHPSAEQIRDRIIEQSGMSIPADIALGDALDPDVPVGRVADYGPLPGDDDPDRIIESAEHGMTFVGEIGPRFEAPSLTPFMKRRLAEIAVNHSSRS